MVFKDAGFERRVILSSTIPGSSDYFLTMSLQTSWPGQPPYERLVRETAEASKTALTLANALGCPPELGSKPLLPKVPCTLTTAHKEVQLELNWKLPPCLLDFIVLEGSILATGGKQSCSAVEPACSTTNTGQGVPSGTLLACLLGDNQLLPSWIGGRLPGREFVPGSWYKPGRKLMDREVTGQVWPTSVVLLDREAVPTKLLCKCLCLYP